MFGCSTERTWVMSAKPPTRSSGPEGMLPFVNGVLQGLAG
jgi:hypothetical protein